MVPELRNETNWELGVGKKNIGEGESAIVTCSILILSVHTEVSIVFSNETSLQPNSVEQTGTNKQIT